MISGFTATIASSTYLWNKFRLMLPFGRLWYTKPDHAIGYAEHRSRSHHAVIRVCDDIGNVIEMYEHNGDFKEW